MGDEEIAGSYEYANSSVIRSEVYTREVWRDGAGHKLRLLLEELDFAIQHVARPQGRVQTLGYGRRSVGHGCQSTEGGCSTQTGKGGPVNQYSGDSRSPA
eukprot:3947359-Pyramimonas_sp.AAC.1